MQKIQSKVLIHKKSNFIQSAVNQLNKKINSEKEAESDNEGYINENNNITEDQKSSEFDDFNFFFEFND